MALLPERRWALGPRGSMSAAIADSDALLNPGVRHPGAAAFLVPSTNRWSTTTPPFRTMPSLTGVGHGNVALLREGGGTTRLRRGPRELRGASGTLSAWALACAGAAASTASVAGGYRHRKKTKRKDEGLWFRPPVKAAQRLPPARSGKGNPLNHSVDLLVQRMGLPTRDAVLIARTLQRWVVDGEGEDPTGTRTKHWTRRLVRGLEQHPTLRPMIDEGADAVIDVLGELERRSAKHGEQVMAIEEQHQAVADGDDGDLESYSEASAWMGESWWLRTAHDQVAKWIDMYFILSAEQLRYGHPSWAFKRPGGLPPGWKRYKLGERVGFWNPEIKRIQRDPPPEHQGDGVSAPPPREPPVALLDVGSCSNPFSRYPDLVAPTAIDIHPNPGSDGVLQADFFDVPILDRQEAGCSDGQRLVLNSEGGLEGIVAGSFDVVVISLVLSYVQDPAKRIEMVSRARHCLRDDRGLLVVLEVGSVLAASSWYKGDAAAEWTRAMEKAGFHLRKYEDEIRDRGRRPHFVNQWVFETAPVREDVELEPLMTPKELPW